jgi:CO dehydrogenase/acetyl-CoA synthase alpha subunit
MYYGIILSKEETLAAVDLIFRTKNILNKLEDLDNSEIIEYFELDSTNFTMEIYYTASKVAFLFGRNYETMRPNETKQDFEKSVQQKVQKLFNVTPNCFIIEIKGYISDLSEYYISRKLSNEA